MDSFEFNKIVASVLVALLVAMVGSLMGHAFISPVHLGKTVLDIQVQKSGAASPEAQKEGIPPIGPFLVSANLENGQAIVKKKCAQCHTVTKGGAHKMGPNLWNIVGKSCGIAAKYVYSSAMKKAEATWTFENLNAFIYKPRKFIKGTKMSFAGLKKEQDRADVVFYLRSLSEAPKPLA